MESMSCPSNFYAAAQVLEQTLQKPTWLRVLLISPLKEANETLYWIELLSMSGYLDTISAEKLTNDCKELLKMLVATTKKTSLRQQ